MLKDPEQPREPLRNKAARMWKNHEVSKRIAEERKPWKRPDPEGDAEITEVLINEGRRDGRVNRFESRFKKEIRAMMEGYAVNNLRLYLYASIERRRDKLLKEKLRRLKAAQQSNTDGVGTEVSNEPKIRGVDLFA